MRRPDCPDHFPLARARANPKRSIPVFPFMSKPMYQVYFHESVRAPRERVFAVFADHARFATLFGGVGRCVQEGIYDTNGLGSVRRIGRGMSSFDETVVAFDEPRRIEYEITRGSLLKNHMGSIELHAYGNVTAVDCSICFDSKIPGLGDLFVWQFKRAWERNGRLALARLTA